MTSCTNISTEIAALRADIAALNNKFATKQDLINLENKLFDKYSVLENRVSILESKISKIDILENLINSLKNLFKFIQELAEKAVLLAGEALKKAADAIGEALMGKAVAAEAKGMSNNANTNANDARNLGEKARDEAGNALIKAGEAIQATKPILPLQRRVEVLEAEYSDFRRELNITFEIAEGAMQLATRNTEAILVVRQTANLALADADDARRTVDYLYPKVIATETKVNTLEADVSWMKLQIIGINALITGIQGEIFLIQGQIVGLLQADLMMGYQIVSINMNITRLDGEVLKTFNVAKQALSSSENAVDKANRLSNKVYQLDGQVTIITNQVSDLWYVVSGLEIRINRIRPIINNYYPTKYQTIIQPKETIILRPYPVPQPIYTTFIQPTQYREVHTRTIQLQPIQTTIIKPTEIRTLREVKTLEKTIVERPYPVPQPIYYTNTIVENKYNTIRETLPLQTIQNNITNTIVKPTEIRTIQTRTEIREVEMIRWIDIQVETISCELQSGNWTPQSTYINVKVMATTTGNEIAKIQNQFAEIAKANRELCLAKNKDEQECSIAVPDMWLIRPEHLRPQVVYTFSEINDQGKDIGKQNYSIIVPHHVPSKPPALPRYKKGNYEIIFVLKDNSKITIHSLDKFEGIKMLNAIKKQIIPEYLKGSYISKSEILNLPDDRKLKEIRVKNVSATYWENGRKTDEGKPKWKVKYD
jgi:hypothetical protein